MTKPGKNAQRRERLADRLDRGDFDAALRPSSHDEALRHGPRQFFNLAAEIARAQFDPTEHWEDFVRALWQQVDAGFGLTAEEDDEAVPRAWFDHPDDPSFVAWDQREGDSSER